MRIAAAVTTGFVILSACTSRPPSAIEPARLSATGDTQLFGRPSAMTGDGRHVVLELKQAANATFFNVHPDGWVDVLISRSLPAGRTEVALPRTELERGTSWRGRSMEAQRRSAMARQRLLRREALLVVVWQRGTDVAPTWRNERLLVESNLPEYEVPEQMFEGRATTWAAWVIDKRN